MKLLYALIIFFISSNFISAQPVLDWEFEDMDSYNYYPTTNIIRNGDFTYVCSQSIDTSKTAYVFRLDSSGNVTSQDSIQHFNYSILRNKRMVMDASGNIYLCGNTLDSLQYSKIQLVKYDPLLNRQWILTYDTIPNDYEVYSLLYSAIDDKLLLVGSEYDGMSYPIVLKFDTDGNLLWKMKDSTHVAFYINTYVTDHFGNLFLGGNGFIPGGAEDLVISKIDSSGANSWFVNFDGSNHSDDGVMDLCISNFDELYISGRFEDTIPHKVMKLDQSGNLLWSTPIPQIYLEKIAVDAAGSAYIAGFDTITDHEYIIYKYDSAGNFIDTAFSDIPDYKGHSVDYFVKIQTDDSANVYLLNNVDTLSETRWLIAKLDSSLNEQWSLVYPDNIPNPSLSSDLCLIDGGFVVSGAVNNFGQLRVLQYHETFSTGISETKFANGIGCWFDQNSETINFRSEQSFNGTYLVTVMDIDSRLLYSKELTVTNNSFSIESDTFGTGVYIVRLDGRDVVYTGKILLY